MEKRPSGLPDHLSIPVDEGRGHVAPSASVHTFSLRTMSKIYARGSDAVAKLERHGFKFQPSTNPYYCWKTANPGGKLVVETMAELLHLVREFGNIVVTPHGALLIADDYALTASPPMQLERLTKPEELDALGLLKK